MKTKEQPVIIIRRKKAGHGHHGGAWKVAYADFVTAMMAFFLVMWLAAQDSRIRDAVAGYFQEPGLLPYQTLEQHHRAGHVAASTAAERRPSTGGSTVRLEAEQQAMRKAAGNIHESLIKLPGFARAPQPDPILVDGRRTADRAGRPQRIELLRERQRANCAARPRRFSRSSPAKWGPCPNEVVIEGHTDSRPYVLTNRYSNWELSSDRANAARRVMMAHGLREHQIDLVRGFADSDLRMPDAPLDPKNRRVSIVIRSQEVVNMDRTVRARQTSAEAIDAVAGGMGPKPSAADAAPAPTGASSGAPDLQPMRSDRAPAAH